MAVPPGYQGVRFYEAGYVDEDESATQSHVRQIWSVNSKFGGSYVSIPTASSSPTSVSNSLKRFTGESGGKANVATRAVTSTAEAETKKNKAVTNINFVKYESDDDTEKKNQPWFYLKFANPHHNGPEFTVSASEYGVTASDQTNDGTIFQVIALCPPNDPYVVIESNKSNGNNKLYLSSDGAGNMKLRVWNAPIPGPPRTTEEVNPAFLFRIVRPLGQN